MLWELWEGLANQSNETFYETGQKLMLNITVDAYWFDDRNASSRVVQALGVWVYTTRYDCS